MMIAVPDGLERTKRLINPLAQKVERHRKEVSGGERARLCRWRSSQEGASMLFEGLAAWMMEQTLQFLMNQQKEMQKTLKSF